MELRRPLFSIGDTDGLPSHKLLSTWLTRLCVIWEITRLLTIRTIKSTTTTEKDGDVENEMWNSNETKLDKENRLETSGQIRWINEAGGKKRMKERRRRSGGGREEKILHEIKWWTNSWRKGSGCVDISSHTLWAINCWTFLHSCDRVLLNSICDIRRAASTYYIISTENQWTHERKKKTILTEITAIKRCIWVMKLMRMMMAAFEVHTFLYWSQIQWAYERFM